MKVTTSKLRTLLTIGENLNIEFKRAGDGVFDEDDVFRLIVPLDDAYSADQALTKTAQETVLGTMGIGEDKGVVKGGMESGMKTADAIIAFMRAVPQITHDLLAAKLGKARNSIIKQIAKLKKTGLIRRIGPDKGGHWEVIG